MARARNLKPSFFKNDVLAGLPALTRLLFAGLWTLADREGRLEERPLRIKAEILPYDVCDIDAMLQSLHDRGFIIRYTASAVRFIEIINFAKHQNPHAKEAASTIPAPDKTGASTVPVPEFPERAPEIPERARLNPSSLNLTPESLNLNPSSIEAVEPFRSPSPSPSASAEAKSVNGKGHHDPPTPTGTRLPAGWRLPEAWRDWACQAHNIDSQKAVRISLVFRDYWHSKPGKDGRKADWEATWRNWVRKELGYA
jgi:hypothetical protein